MRHHDEALSRYASNVRADPAVLAVLVTGSVARGVERADSDIDLVLVVTDDEWDAARAEGRIMFTLLEGVGYPGGYFDIKLMTLTMLDAAARAGDEPVLSSLGEAQCLLDRSGRVEHLLDAVHAGAVGQRPELAASFLAQARLHGGYFTSAAAASGDPFLLAHAAVHLAQAAGRAVLAARGVRFSSPKQMIGALRALPGLPEGFVEAVLEVVGRPGEAAAGHLLALLEQQIGDLLPSDATLSRFVLDNEIAWFTGVTPPEYR